MEATSIQIAALLVAMSLALSMVVPARAQIGLDYDTAKSLQALVKNLLKGGDSAAVSKGIRMTDADTGRRLSLRLVSHADVDLMMTFEFPAADERIFPHTLRITADQTVLTPRLLDIRESRDEDDPELVLAPMSTQQLDTLADAQRVVVLLKGWDVEFEAELDEKGMGKLRKFRDARAAGS